MTPFSTLQDVRFSFSGAGGTAFSVVQFRGTEGISRPFSFDIDLLSDTISIDLDAALQQPASFTLYRGADTCTTFSGVLASFEVRDAGPRHALYRALLVPKLWLLTLTVQNRVFQDTSVPKMVETVLKDHGFTGDDYQLRLTDAYAEREYVVQYQETDLAFLSRWMEYEGIFYFFDEGRLIIADSQAAHRAIAAPSTLPFRSATGLSSGATESVHQAICRQSLRQNEVLLTDYNWRKPTLDLSAQEPAGTGAGTLVEYGNHYKTTDEGARLARIRGEELSARKRLLVGDSDCRGLRAGYQFELIEHSRSDLNARYLLIEVEHEGRQVGTNAEGHVVSLGGDGTDYRNTFVAIPAVTPFRPERVTPKPRLYGTVNATVDAAADGTYAEVDDQGRYKVILPFDLSGRKDGKASRFVRMAQPYAGPEYGMHFPLHKGTEVLLTCIDGDLDRPIICGAVPNPDTASPVTKANQTSSVIRDHRGNEMNIEGTEGKEFIRLHSPNLKTTLVLGGAIVEYTEGSRHVRVLGESRTHVTKDTHQIIEGDLATTVRRNHAHVIGEEHLIRAKRIVLEADDEICLQVGGSFVSLRGSHIGIESRIVDVNAGDSCSGSSISSLAPQEPERPQG